MFAQRKLEEIYKTGDREKIEDELGDILFAVVNIARKMGVDSEHALRGTIKKFSDRFRFIESEASRMKKNLKDMTLSEMDRLWEKAKKEAI